MLLFDAREPLVEPLELEREPFVVDPHQMEERGVERVHVDGVLDDVVAEVVGLPEDRPPLGAAAGHPHAEVARMVVAAVGVGGERPLRVDGAAELPSPDDEGVVEHPAALEVLDERGRRLIGVEALGLEIVGKIAVVVPTAVEDLHDANAALDEPAGEDQAVGEGAGLADVVAVHGERLGRFTAEVDQIGHTRLHPKGHLILGDAGLGFGIVKAVVAAGVERAEGIEHHAPVGPGDAVGVGEIEDRIP